MSFTPHYRQLDPSHMLKLLVCLVAVCDGFLVGGAYRRQAIVSRCPIHHPPRQATLYDDQEVAITKRGEYEESIMVKSTPIVVNKPRGAGSSGGFGGSNTKGLATKEQAKAHAKVLRKDGVVRIDNVIPRDVADDLSSFVHDLRETAEQQVEDNVVERRERFADVLLRKNRCDLTMPLTDVTYRGLHALLCQSPVGATMQTLLGKKSVLYEFSCLISDPGSDRQVIHPDTPLASDEDDQTPVLYTCFVALQDMTLDMGPTCWIPGTHTKDVHEQFQKEQSYVEGELSPKDQLLQVTPSVLGVLPKGSCGIFDSRLLHGGTANRSDISRAIFYVSFKNPALGYPGNPASIRPSLSGQLTLQELQQELEAYVKGKPYPKLEALAENMM